MRKENDLGNDNITALLFKLAIPSMIAQFVNVLYSIVDRIFISNIPLIGDLALAGVGVAAPIITIITSFCYLVALGGAPLLAIRLGEKRPELAQKIMSNCFTALLAVSFLITGICLLIKEPMLMLFGASENTFLYANEYLTIYLLGTVFAMLSLGLNSFITCQGFSKVAMFSILIGAATNIVLDPIFIFALDMGVRGAAIATVIAQFVSFAFAVHFLMGKRSYVKLSFKGLSFKIMKKIMTLGFSPFCIMATEGVIIVALNTALQNFGGDLADYYVAGGTIVVCFMQLITIPLGGLTMGAQPLMSYNFGAKNFDRIKKAFKGLLLMCLTFNVIMFIFAQTVPQLFVAIFTNSATTAAIAIRGIKIYTLGTIFLTTQYACVDTLTALGSAKYAIFLSMLRKVGILLTLTIVLPMLFGVEATFFAEPVADILGGIISIIVFSL
ncbi:MAG: MATE family efflux transporter, partial [Clostridia bacterium]